MRYNRKFKIFLIIALVVALSSLSLAYAILAQNLTIKGTGEVKGATWDIVFEGPVTDKVSRTSAASTETKAPDYKPPTLSNNNMTLSNYQVTLWDKNDWVEFHFKVHNKGTIAAKLNEVIKSTPQCEGLSSVTGKQDGEKMCKIVRTSLKYEATDGEAEVKGNDTLAAGESKNMVLKVYIESSTTDENLPQDDVRVTGGDITLKYVQDDSNN